MYVFACAHLYFPALKASNCAGRFTRHLAKVISHRIFIYRRPILPSFANERERERLTAVSFAARYKRPISHRGEWRIETILMRARAPRRHATPAEKERALPQRMDNHSRWWLPALVLWAHNSAVCEKSSANAETVNVSRSPADGRCERRELTRWLLLIARGYEMLSK